MKKPNKPCIEEAIKKLVKSGKLKPLKTDRVCHADYAVPKHVTQKLYRKIRIIKHK